LFAQGVNGQPIACAHVICEDVTRPWWTADGQRVRFLVREGWARASIGIYEWIPGPDAPRRLYLTDDVLVDCAPIGDDLICLREGSLQPRRLERLALASGHRTVLFDPNPGFARLRTGAVERLKLRNSFGLESVADLVLPVGYRPGTRYPLVVVQYDTRGFLRGGTGDEYPIQAFANRGYAVLSAGQPRSVARDDRSSDNPAAVSRKNLAGFADRRSALSSVETGVQLLVDRGIADPARIGITGFSNGATTTTFALLQSKLFSAAAMSSCCFDTTLPTRVGPYAARYFAASGYPRLIDRDDDFWKSISLSLNARRVSTPILLQVPEREMMSALESYTALREADQPIDMYVFPDEYHSKKQPAHRLAIYRRALDWFDYWLKGERSAAPDRQRELVHWDTLKRERARP
jgi:dipeptidyl aminopeptidase/acylaminoacyl peptidase